MSQELANQLLEAGVHFGHQTRKWNPKMKPFIYGIKNGVYIVNLETTVEYITRACDFVRKIAASGGKILLVGTKPQAQPIIIEAAERTGMPYVQHRWLGGLLTNYDTVRRSVSRYLKLKSMEHDGSFDMISKKETSQLKKEMLKLEKNLKGVAYMGQLPAAMFVIDAKREDIAIKEAVRLNIPVVAIADTDANPDLLTYPIPGNDDAIRSIRFITQKIADAILEGAAGRPIGDKTSASPKRQTAKA